MKSNEFGLRYGVYSPSLPVKRLVPSTGLNKNGWKIVLNPPGEESFISFPWSPKKFILINVPPQIPYLKDDLIFDDNQCLSLYSDLSEVEVDKLVSACNFSINSVGLVDSFKSELEEVDAMQGGDCKRRKLDKENYI